MWERKEGRIWNDWTYFVRELREMSLEGKLWMIWLKLLPKVKWVKRGGRRLRLKLKEFDVCSLLVVGGILVVPVWEILILS